MVVRLYFSILQVRYASSYRTQAHTEHKESQMSQSSRQWKWETVLHKLWTNLASLFQSSF